MQLSNKFTGMHENDLQTLMTSERGDQIINQTYVIFWRLDKSNFNLKPDQQRSSTFSMKHVF